MPVQMQNIEYVARLVAAREGEHLVHDQVDGMEQEAHPVVSSRGHESPARLARPLDLGCLFLLPHDRTDIARLVEVHVDRVPVPLEQVTVSGERLRDPLVRVVEVVEGMAVALRVRLEQDCRTAGEVGVDAPVPQEQPSQVRLVIR